MEAVREQTRATLEHTACLAKLHERIGALESSNERILKDIDLVADLIGALYLGFKTLVEIFGDRARLDLADYEETMKRIRDRQLEKANAIAGIKVEAAGDVSVSADKVGGDKKEGA